ncbi:MAG TPA: folylpolyglutamate synthase/dihydrofolate synthase family protein [Candidatus Limnocylindrales bacterium]|nr:folylpolyglutamate synthase/dihydrofolate synthase family protein [Candidatus Limnocylindrales bacterium]
MAITYENAVERLIALGHELATHRKFDLEHMRVLAAALGHPERRLQSVLIAGTNGKGSTAATLASIVQAAGYRTGLYTSPHLIRVNERIRVNGESISDPEFALIFERVDRAAQELVANGSLPWYPSFFEVLTAMMFEYFASVGVELAVLEVGMGGRLDATNIAEPAISVITDIDFDHQKFLGNTLPEIAREKAGIIRPGGTVVLLPQHPQVNDTLGKEIMARNAQPVSAVQYMPPLTPSAHHGRRNGESTAAESFPIEVAGAEISITPPLPGRHQFRNLALAIAAAQQLNHFGFRVQPRHIEQGVRGTQWPARFQVIAAESASPEIVLDVAHNPAGAWALRSTLSERYQDLPLTFIFGAMRDKAISEIAGILFPLAECVILTQADNPRAATPAELRDAAQHTGATLIEAADVSSALERARAQVGSNGGIVITGSIYIVGEALKLLSAAPATQGAWHG